MAKPMATGRELTRLRKLGMEATPENLRKVKQILRQEDMKKSEARNRKGMKAGKQFSKQPKAVAKKTAKHRGK